jgi:potassium efflux system protein
MTLRLCLWLALTVWVAGQGATAQVAIDGLLSSPAATPEETTAQRSAAEDVGDPKALDAAERALANAVPDLSDWQSRVGAAEELLGTGTGASLALSRTRETLFGWRDRFQALGSLNAGRISTVQGQISALGTVPESGEEQPAILERRTVLNRQLDELSAPAVLAREAYARADGLISEVDSQLRARDTARLTARSPSPLNPANWPDAVQSARTALESVVSAAAARISTRFFSGAIWPGVPLSIVYLAVALVLLLRSRSWVSLLQDRVENSHALGRAIWSFLLSLWQIVLPTLGLAALILGLRQLGVLARSGDALSQAIFGAGFVVIVARWLNGQLFPHGDQGGPLGYPADVRGRIRSSGVALGVGLAAIVIVTALMQNAGASDASIGVVTLPLQVLLAAVLFRLGYLLRHAPMDWPGRSGSGGRVRVSVGLLCIIVAIASPVLAGAGFAAAFASLFAPAVMTLAIFGVIIVLQKLVYDIYAPISETEEVGPLMPVVIGFVLFMLAVPVLSLVWGASVTDLAEVVAQFRAGFQVGETTISPTDFMTFVLIFGGGYLLTKFITRQLKITVLPRTRMDLGGQNAVAAGVGYVGIFLAALIAITTAGIDLSSLAIVAGALSVGIGFGLQTIVQNFVSGIILLIERPIGEGDMIEVNGNVGFVRNISVRSTRIETFDRTDVIIPNADLVSGQVTNWTRGNLVGRLILPIGVAYGSDVEQVRTILLEIAQDHPMVIAEPGPQALFMAFGASSLDFELRMILRDVNWKVVATDELLRKINERFNEAGIEIPFAQTDIWLRNPEALHAQPPKGAKPVPPTADGPDDIAKDGPKVGATDGPDTARSARAMMGSGDLHDNSDADPDASPDGETQ